MTKTQQAIIAEVLEKLTLKTASFAPFNDTKDAEIKNSIRLWVDTWIDAPLRVVLALDGIGDSDPATLDYYRRKYGRRR